MAPHGNASEFLTPTSGAKTLPAVEVLTGRGFITGKSGSGKSNTASVIAEELLDNGYGLLIVDTEGEYYGLGEEYELLHAGNDEDVCDIKVGPNDADHLASMAIDENVPVVLDVSEFLDGEIAQELIANVVRQLYHLEKDARKPFLLMIEELQEYLPQSGGGGELPDLLERVAKRGRKRGLGMLGMSQRPSSVDKDFITQCDWMVWHRLTWKNDVDVVRNILGPDIANSIEQLDTGEGYIMTDWDDQVERVQFKRKRTHDAGATPGLDAYQDGRRVEPGKSTAEKSAGDSDTIGSETTSGAVGTGGGLDGAHNANVEAARAELEAIELDLSDTEALEDASQEELIEAIHALQNYTEELEADRESLQSSLQSSVARYESARNQRGNTRRNTGGSESATSKKLPSKPAPQPPVKPEQRTGFSGNLIEFTAMCVYLVRIFIYRMKRMFYRIGMGPQDEQRSH